MYPSGLLLALIVAAYFLVQLRWGSRSYRRQAKELDLLIKSQGIIWPNKISPGVMFIAKTQSEIAAIQLHREKNPHLTLREAKKDIDDLMLELASKSTILPPHVSR